MITPMYAAMLGLIFVALSAKTIKTRRRQKVAIGHGDDTEVLRACRVHGNFAEYVPFALLLIFMLEQKGSHDLLIHGLCVVLLVGRVVHAYGVSQVQENFRFRVMGMAMTFMTIVSACTGLLGVGVISQWFS